LELIAPLPRESRAVGGPGHVSPERPGADAREAIQARRWRMIFQQFLYPQTGCAAYVFG
jgi:hypothetical protein